MSYYDLCWYVNAGNQSTTGYYAVAKRPQNAAVTAGQLVRQFTAPAVNNERVFVCILAGTTANTTDASWGITRGAITNDGTANWRECTGIAAVNGDAANTVNWTSAKAIGSPSVGTIIKRNNGASYQMCIIAGAMGASEPAFSDTAGVTTVDSSASWVSLGVVGNFTGGQAPHARINPACAPTWFAAGNTIYVGDNHAESQTTAITINPTGSATTISRVLCHNHSGSYPPASTDLTTGATISTTAASVNLTYSGIGGFYFYGLSLRAGVGVSTAVNSMLLTPSSGSFVIFDNCSFWLSNSTASNASQVQIGASGAAATTMIFNNVTVRFAVVTNFISTGNGVIIWQNTGAILASGSSVPNNLFNFAGASPGTACQVVLEALDLSQLTGGLYLATTALTSLLVKDCKLNAAMTAATPSFLSAVAQFVRSDFGATAYQSSRYTVDGTETTETSITRVGGASDPTGQAQSRKIVTTANSQWLRPFKAEPYATWNPTTGANVTVTVYGTVNAGSLPFNDDIWLEVEYLGSPSTPLGTIVTTTKTNLLAANAAVASDSSTWDPPAAAFATFDGTASNATLSNGNLTGTHANTNNNSGARSTTLLSSGKYYFEVTVGNTHGLNDSAGVLLSTGTYTDLVTNGLNCVVVNLANGALFGNNVASTKSLPAIGAGDVIGIAIDLGNRNGWFRKNGGNWNGLAIGSENPATNAGGVPIASSGSFSPAIGFGGTSSASGDNMTANFGVTSFAFTPPSGFGYWVASTGSWSPFKLTITLSAPQPGMAGYLHARVRAAKPSTTWYIDPQITLS